jgi:predicted dehydrogenase
MTRRELIALAGPAPAFLRNGLAANDRINVGFIGVGNMGTSRLNGFLKHPDVNVAALCDLDDKYLARATGIVKTSRGVEPPVMKDFRKLLERKDIDAVCIATPTTGTPCPPSTPAKAGKDVFVEKPLSYSIGEGRAMVTAARKHNRVTQMGNHIHNDLPNYRRVVELVRSGVVGQIKRVHVWKTSESKGLGAPPDAPPPAGSTTKPGSAPPRAAPTIPTAPTSTTATSGTTPAACSSTSGAISPTSPIGRST